MKWLPLNEFFYKQILILSGSPGVLVLQNNKKNKNYRMLSEVYPNGRLQSNF
jgi:hypothetical protein